MSGKPKGWKGEKQRHGMARRGLQTVPEQTKRVYQSRQGVYQSRQGVYLPSEGITDWLKDKWGSFRHGVDKLRYGGEAADKLEESREKVRETKEKEKEQKRIRKEKEAELKAARVREMEAKKMERVEKAQERLKGKELIKPSPKPDIPSRPDVTPSIPSRPDIQPYEPDNDFYGDKPHPFEDGVTPVGERVGNLLGDITTYKRPLTDVEISQITDGLLVYPNSDIIIDVANQKKEMLRYTTELKRMIDLLEAAKRGKREEYLAEEDRIYRSMSNDLNLAKTTVIERIKDVRVSGLPIEEEQHTIQELKNSIRLKEQKRKMIYVGTKEQNRADLNYVDNLINGLNRIHRQVDQRFQRITESR